MGKLQPAKTFVADDMSVANFNVKTSRQTDNGKITMYPIMRTINFIR
jgi:hypothetical protein